jgi:uncharacterized membrane protein
MQQIDITLFTVGLPAHLSYDAVLSWLLQTVIFLANLAGGLVVGVAVVRGLLTFLYDLIIARGAAVPKEGIRLSLGRSLALALEFQLGADILGTALNPSLRDIEVLGAIVILRTVLNFFLQRELSRAAGLREGGDGSSGGNDGALPGAIERQRVTRSESPRKAGT